MTFIVHCRGDPRKHQGEIVWPSVAKDITQDKKIQQNSGASTKAGSIFLLDGNAQQLEALEPINK